MIVAVAVFLPSDVLLPPQQSPILGHRASSHTVCKLSPRRSLLILLNDSPDGIEVLRYEGSRGLSIFLKNNNKECITFSIPFRISKDYAVRHFSCEEIFKGRAIFQRFSKLCPRRCRRGRGTSKIATVSNRGADSQRIENGGHPGSWSTVKESRSLSSSICFILHPDQSQIQRSEPESLGSSALQ